MASFFDVFKVSGSMSSPESGYHSEKEPYFDFELLFLVATATRVERRVQNVVLYSVLWSKYGQTTETAVNDFVQQKDHRK